MTRMQIGAPLSDIFDFALCKPARMFFDRQGTRVSATAPMAYLRALSDEMHRSVGMAGYKRRRSAALVEWQNLAA